MAKRDYINPSPKKSNTNKILIVCIISAILFSISTFFWFLKERAPITKQPVELSSNKVVKELSVLPTRPEERYSYIRDLETREIPIDETEYNIDKITKSNQQQESSKQPEQQNISLPDKNTPEYTIVENNTSSVEQKTQNEPTTKVKQEIKPKPEPKKVEVSKPVVANKGQFGLQCGAFKNKAQADNMHARLSMNGFPSHVSVRGQWNRVFVGPVGSKNNAKQLEKQVKKIADCFIVAM